MMNSRSMKKMASDVVKVSKKLVKTKSGKSEKHSLISADQPLSDSHGDKNRPIPKGFVAVYVGPHDRRFVIPTRFLSVPDFKAVMEMAAEEFGYEQQGGLRIPCDEDDFQNLLAVCKFKSTSTASFRSHSHHIPVSN